MTITIQLLIFVILWGILVYVFVTKLNNSLFVERESEALKQLDKNGQKNYELRKIIENFLIDFDNTQQISSQNKIIENLKYQLQNVATNPIENKILQNSNNIVIQPLSKYEELRRRVRQNTKEMWNYFNLELVKIRKSIPYRNVLSDQIKSVLQLGAEHKRSLISDIDEMRSVDGYELWRQQEAYDLSDLVQRRLSFKQNPMDCKNANKLICRIVSHCGFGCQLHDLIYCFMKAYGVERTMILNSKDWIYQKAGWEEVFQPVSETCTVYNITGTRYVIAEKSKSNPCLPLTIPADLAPRLIKLHGEPSGWWIGQLLKYLLKPNHKLQKILQINMEKLDWKKPIVGIHIRRGDKIVKEAEFHTVEEYMTYVEDYYLTLDINSKQKVERRVYLASDDDRVFIEVRKKYPQYKIIGDPKITKTSKRYTVSSLNRIILDIQLLSLSDYLVCTFSSNVCRIAYEIMQSYYPDASDRFQSLDDNYFYCIPNSTHKKEVLLPHKSRNKDEINLEPGDLITAVSNHWGGFSKGKNLRTSQIGIFPTFKVKDKIETFNYQYIMKIL